jgi:hypothetical protein
MDDVVNEPAADWDDKAPPAAIAGPAAADTPLQAMAIHDAGDGMVQVRYLDQAGKVHHADLPAATPMLKAFQDVLRAYWADIEGAAANHASTIAAAGQS